MKSIRCRVGALLAALVAIVAVDQARLPLGARHLGALECDARTPNEKVVS
jgi:hypothetical protein